MASQLFGSFCPRWQFGVCQTGPQTSGFGELSGIKIFKTRLRAKHMGSMVRFFWRRVLVDKIGIHFSTLSSVCQLLFWEVACFVSNVAKTESFSTIFSVFFCVLSEAFLNYSPISVEITCFKQQKFVKIGSKKVGEHVNYRNCQSKVFETLKND